MAERDIYKVLAEPTVDVADAARVLGISIASAYRARAAGEIPSLRVGGVYRVPTAKLRVMLGISDPAPEASQAA